MWLGPLRGADVKPSWKALNAWVISDASLPLEKQFFQVLCLLAGLLSIFVIVPVNQFQHLSPWVDRVVLAFGLTSLALTWAARHGHYCKKTMLFSIIVCLDLVWFPNGGSLGSIGLYFFSAALFLVLFFEGAFRFGVLALLLVNIIGLHLAEQLWPLLAHPFNGPMARLLDLSTGYITSMVVCALMLGVILAGSKGERRRLAESERMYRELLECQGEGFSVVDDQERFLVVNRVAEEIFGVGPGQLLGRTVTEFLPLDQRERVLQETRLRAQGIHSTYEIQIRREDGTLRTLLITATPRFTQDNGVLQVIGVFRDITEWKETETRLQESEETFRTHVEQSFDVIFTLDTQGTFLFVSPAWERHFGYPVSEVLEKSFALFMHADDFQPCYDYLGRVLLTGQSATSPPYRVRHADGSWRWFSANGTRLVTPDGEPRFVGVAHDITERKLAEEELKRSDEALKRQNELFSSLLKILPVGVFMVEAPTGKPLVANEMALSLLGRGILPDASKRNLSEVYKAYKLGTGDPYPLDELPILLGMRGLSSHVEDMMIDRPDGTNALLEVFGTPVMDDQGNIWASLVSFFDISERKKADGKKAQLEAQNRQLQKAESLGRMAGSIAHHFNNKLQSVMGNLELIGGLAEGMDPAKYVARAKQATEKAAEMSRLMLVYLGQTLGKGEPRYLSEICRESLPLIQGAVPATVPLVTEYPWPGPIVNANADQLQQVMTNLVINAWEAMGDAKGSIRLSLNVCPAADIPTSHRFPVGWQPSGSDYACLAVADTGAGVAEADLEKLFDPFFSTKFSGRGLGLSVILGIVQAHGGAVTVESHRGQGSVFRVYLPISTEAVPSVPETVIKPLRADGSGAILLVDDDEILLGSTGALIEMMGFNLLTARDGVEAVEVFRQNRDQIRCVITDLTMPRMDGWETLAALRQLDPTLPVIMASGYDKGRVMSGQQVDRPHVFLEKPFGLQDLCDAIGQALMISGREES